MDVIVEGESPLKDPHFSLAISEAFATDRRRASPQEDGTSQLLLFLWDGGLVKTLFARMKHGEMHLGTVEGTYSGALE